MLPCSSSAMMYCLKTEYPENTPEAPLMEIFRPTRSRISCRVTRSAAMSQLEMDIATEMLVNLPSTISETPLQRRDSSDAASTEFRAETLEPIDECSEAMSQSMELCRPGSQSIWAMPSAAFNSSMARNGLPVIGLKSRKKHEHIEHKKS